MGDRMSDPHDGRLGDFLRDCRARLDPVALGYPAGRRRTTGLRREEVAGRAHISPTWYTCLEQGRGGAPSAEVLERLARALMMTDAERELLFLIALGRPPEGRYQAPDGITPRLQHILDALDPNPAVVKTATWDIIAWNQAAVRVLSNYPAIPPQERNMLRFIFLNPQVRAAQSDWEGVARALVAAFRTDITRAGAQDEAQALVDELCRRSPEFDAMWRSNEAPSRSEAPKHLRHPVLGPVSFEYTAFSVDGRNDLSMIVYYPASEADAAKIHGLARAERREPVEA